GPRTRHDGVAQSRRVRQAVVGEMPRCRDLRAQEARVAFARGELFRGDERRAAELRTTGDDPRELEEGHGAHEHRAWLRLQTAHDEATGLVERVDARTQSCTDRLELGVPRGVECTRYLTHRRDSRGKRLALIASDLAADQVVGLDASRA